MVGLMLGILVIFLIVYFASGVWAVRRRRRTITEGDYQRAAQWRAECLAEPSGQGGFLRSLDIALHDGSALPPDEDSQSLLPSNEQKA